jgi:pyruvate formate lyase activating enzyme
MTTVPIRGFLPNTLIDWPGKLAAELFLGGCNLRCPYCHAGDVIETSPEAETFLLADILTHLEHEADWLDGVVISGGEPTIHPQLPELCRPLRDAGFLLKLDTNGTQVKALEALLSEGLLDCVALDVKAPLDERYRRVTGRSDVAVESVRGSLRLLRDWGGGYELRTTVCPAVLDPEDVVELAAELQGAPGLVLQQFQPGHCLEPALNQVEPYPEALLLELAERCRAYLPRVSVRGREGALAQPPS